MPPRDWRLRIDDILAAIAKLERYTGAIDYAAFASDELVVDAVEHNFTVIGEAARGLPVEITERYASIPWAQLRGMRNVVVHHYFGVNLPVIWDTIKQNLPQLVEQLERLLEAES